MFSFVKLQGEILKYILTNGQFSNSPCSSLGPTDRDNFMAHFLPTPALIS